MTDEKKSDRQVIADALTILTKLNDDDELPGSLRGMIAAASEAATNGVRTDEKCDGAITILLGDKGSHHIEMSGGFNPVVVYGAMVDAILEVYSTVQESKAEQVVRSFVGDVETAAAQIEKAVTKPDEH